MGRLAGLVDRLRRRPAPPVELDPLDPSLERVITAADPARADSAVLAEAAGRGVDLDRPLLVRHHLVALPDADAVEEARRLLERDGWAVVPGEGRPLALAACRTEVLTAVSASRERSRMAGLAQRLGGDVAGWDALRPPSPDPAG